MYSKNMLTYYSEENKKYNGGKQKEQKTCCIIIPVFWKLFVVICEGGRGSTAILSFISYDQSMVVELAEQEKKENYKKQKINP